MYRETHIFVDENQCPAIKFTAPNEIEYINPSNPVAKSSLKPVNVSNTVVWASAGEISHRLPFIDQIFPGYDIIHLSFLFLYLYEYL